MYKIKKANLFHLRTAEDFAFHNHITNLINDSADIDITAKANDYIAAFEAFDKAMGKQSRSLLTKKILIADKRRKFALSGFIKVINGFKNNPISNLANSAEMLKLIIDTYATTIYKPYNEQTGLLYNMQQDLDKPVNKANIEAINAKSWTDELKAAQAQFEQLFIERAAEETSLKSEAVSTFRKETDKAYREFVTTIEALLRVKSTAELISFAALLNTYIEYDKNAIAIRKGRAAKRKEPGIDI